ncbi:MAG TPA: squalene synthase HpnC [Phycisphaerales bacterium]|nr:squalene synthase HpnC [Phycisphaerales bacterium]HRQ76547.1 squalene synthase HpnC [Phycisphaerales bacterium]
MTANPVDQLSLYGPDRCDTLSVEQARSWCRRLALGHYENFSVLSSLVPRTPPELRDDFAAVYAFCRWADDLGDEIGDSGRSLELLAWWRRELEQCFSGDPRHPVFIALRPTIERCNLPIEPFDNLISAFEQDQRINRYETWEQLIDYCRRSADPVGRLVLMVCGEVTPGNKAGLFPLSDAICTALQLTNHWQDVKRDILERDRIYIPQELIRIENFEERLIASAKQGWAVDRTFLQESRELIRECVERTWKLYETGEPLLDRVSNRSRPLILLFARGGQHVLRSIEMWNYETVLHRPTLTPWRKALLVAQAWLSRGRRRGAGVGA